MDKYDRSTVAAPAELCAKISALEASGAITYYDGADLAGATLSPVMKVQLDATGRTAMMDDGQDNYSFTREEVDILLFAELLDLKPMTRKYCRFVFTVTETSLKCEVVPGYVQEQYGQEPPLATKDDDGDESYISDLPPGSMRVVDERLQQLGGEDFTLSDDVQYTQNELLIAALHYIEAALIEDIEGVTYEGVPPALGGDREWPFDETRWKPTSSFGNLVKAGALLMADVDRRGYLMYLADKAAETSNLETQTLDKDIISSIFDV